MYSRWRAKSSVEEKGPEFLSIVRAIMYISDD